MNKPRIAIVGGSGHGRVALDAARRQDRYEVVGWLDSRLPAGRDIAGLNVLGQPTRIDELAVNHRLDGVFLGISDNWTRAQVWEEMRKRASSLELVSIVHPASVVAPDAALGAGTLVLAGAIVNPGARIGIQCIVNTRVSLDHDSELKSHASLLPGVVTGGNVVVGEFACVCIGSVLAHQVRIGEHTVVGAGSVVLADLPGYVLAYGTPARPVRARQAGERHF
jgi:sugar O-acyltransferase (sialic acid O-acetyltransferase NeuD family)